jgi:alcohol dehydrogenase class IV
LEIQPLRALGVRQAEFPVIIEKAQASSSMKGNPVPLTDAELREILERAW